MHIWRRRCTINTTAVSNLSPSLSVIGALWRHTMSFLANFFWATTMDRSHLPMNSSYCMCAIGVVLCCGALPTHALLNEGDSFMALRSLFNPSTQKVYMSNPQTLIDNCFVQNCQMCALVSAGEGTIPCHYTFFPFSVHASMLPSLRENL